MREASDGVMGMCRSASGGLLVALSLKPRLCVPDAGYPEWGV